MDTRASYHDCPFTRMWAEPEIMEMPRMPSWSEQQHQNRIAKLPKKIRLKNGQIIWVK